MAVGRLELITVHQFVPPIIIHRLTSFVRLLSCFSFWTNHLISLFIFLFILFFVFAQQIVVGAVNSISQKAQRVRSLA